MYNFDTQLVGISLNKQYSVFFITKINICVTIVNNYVIFNMSKSKAIEKEKVVAEQINGRFAMLGFMAAIGAYLTTGQIIPGIV